MIQVLLADDQDLVRTGFRMILDEEDDIEVVGEAADGNAAVTLAGRLTPHVILMDIRMPDLDGIEATRRIMAVADPGAIRVLILTTFDPDEYIYDALSAGASGFLLKDALAEDLVAAVRTVAAGEAALAPSITRRLIDDLIQRPRRPGSSEALGALTEREQEVLRLIAKGHTNAEIAGALYVGESTVKTHVSHLLSKLQLRDRVQAVILAYETGFVAPGDRI